MIVADYANQLDTPEIVDRSLKRDDHINDYDNDHDGSHDKIGGVDLFILFYLAQCAYSNARQAIEIKRLKS